MKYLALLLALFATAANAETILMQCIIPPANTETFRYSDGIFGWATPKYQVREDGGGWSEFCTPQGPTSGEKVDCIAEDRGIIKYRFDADGGIAYSANLDFLALTYKEKRETYPCKRLD